MIQLQPQHMHVADLASNLHNFPDKKPVLRVKCEYIQQYDEKSLSMHLKKNSKARVRPHQSQTLVVLSSRAKTDTVLRFFF